MIFWSPPLRVFLLMCYGLALTIGRKTNSNLLYETETSTLTVSLLAPNVIEIDEDAVRVTVCVIPVGLGSAGGLIMICSGSSVFPWSYGSEIQFADVPACQG